jgi:hypothetical protein
MDDFTAHLDALGGLIPCSLCRTFREPADLTESYVPGYVIAEWDVVVSTLVWICPNCPDPGSPSDNQ